MCLSQESDVHGHERDREESENEPDHDDWESYQDEFLEKPPFLKDVIESSEFPEDNQEDQYLVSYRPNKTKPFQHSRTDTPDVSLALASAIEFITSKIAGDNAYIVKEQVFKLLIKAKLIRPEYLSDGFSETRRKFMVLLGSLISSVDRGTKLTFNFSPNIENPLSIKNGTFTIGPSRYCQDFEEIKCIGSGGFGEVFKVRSKLDEQFYAIKKIRLRKVRNPMAFEKMVNECRLHASLVAHPHLLRYHNAWIECEYMPSEIISSDEKTPNIILSPIELSEKIKIRTDGAHPSTSESSASESSPGNNKFWQKRTQATQESSPSPFVTFDEASSNENSQNSKSTELPTNDTSSTQGSTDDSDDRVLVPRNTAVASPEPNYSKFLPVLHIQMELCETTLEKYLSERNAQKSSIDDEFNKKVIRSLLSAITFLHKNSIIHRDIKPSNIFLKRHKDGYHILLGDFGLAKDQSHVYEVDQPTTSAPNSPNTVKKLSLGIGTYSYASPEQLTSRTYDSKTDIYSSGVVFYEMYNIFHTSMERSRALKQLRQTSNVPEEFQNEHPLVAELINIMVKVDASQRPTAEKLLKIFDKRISTRRSHLVEENQALRRENKELLRKTTVLEEEIERLRKKYEALEAIVRLQSGT